MSTRSMSLLLTGTSDTFKLNDGHVYSCQKLLERMLMVLVDKIVVGKQKV